MLKNTILRTKCHIKLVRKQILRTIKILKLRSKMHDFSKLVEPELSGFNKMDCEDYCAYGSPQYFEKIKKYRSVLAHHYERNSHHPEHYDNGITDMDLIDLIEMVCDWAAYKRKITDFEAVELVKRQSERYVIDRQLSSILLNTIRRIYTEKNEKVRNYK